MHNFRLRDVIGEIGCRRIERCGRWNVFPECDSIKLSRNGEAGVDTLLITAGSALRGYNRGGTSATAPRAEARLVRRRGEGSRLWQGPRSEPKRSRREMTGLHNAACPRPPFYIRKNYSSIQWKGYTRRREKSSVGRGKGCTPRGGKRGEKTSREKVRKKSKKGVDSKGGRVVL